MHNDLFKIKIKQLYLLYSIKTSIGLFIFVINSHTYDIKLNIKLLKS